MEKAHTDISPEKQRAVEKIFGGKPDAIFIMSGEIVSRSAQSGFRSTSYRDIDSSGRIIGGRPRVIAGAIAHKYFRDAFLVPTSRDGNPNRGRPTHADVYAKELKTRGVPENRILPERKSVGTIGEIVAAIEMAHAHGWRTIAFMSNEYHLRRIEKIYWKIDTLAKFGSGDEAEKRKERFKHALQEFRKGGVALFVNAEQVVSLEDRRYRAVVEKTKKGVAWHARVLAEERGNFDLDMDRYGK